MLDTHYILVYAIHYNYSASSLFFPKILRFQHEALSVPIASSSHVMMHDAQGCNRHYRAHKFFKWKCCNPHQSSLTYLNALREAIIIAMS